MCPKERLDVLRPERVALLPRLHLHRRQVEALRVEAEVAPQRMEGAQRLNRLVKFSDQHLHAGPEALEAS